MIQDEKSKHSEPESFIQVQTNQNKVKSDLRGSTSEQY